MSERERRPSGNPRSQGVAEGPPPPRALTIAGSDSGGGAGIQADLKTFQELGVFGMSVVTALTAQNSLGVQRIEAVSPAMVEAQLDSVLGDIGADAAKTGMLPTAAVVEATAAALKRYGVRRLVVDPVRAAKDGSELSGGEAFEAMKEKLLPLAEVFTPNVPEACVLLNVGDRELASIDERIDAARALLALGPRHVLLKGGHAPGDASVDVLVSAATPGSPLLLELPRLPTPHTHGTGCATAAAIAAMLAAGRTAEEACRAAKAFVHAAISRAVPLGSGIGSLWHAAWRDGDGDGSCNGNGNRNRNSDGNGKSNGKSNGSVNGVRSARFPGPT